MMPRRSLSVLKLGSCGLLLGALAACDENRTGAVNELNQEVVEAIADWEAESVGQADVESSLDALAVDIGEITVRLRDEGSDLDVCLAFDGLSDVSAIVVELEDDLCGESGAQETPYQAFTLAAALTAASSPERAEQVDEALARPATVESIRELVREGGDLYDAIAWRASRLGD